MSRGTKADAIVVLGCRSLSRLRRRLELAIEVFREGAAPALLLSGGGSGAEPEAEIMRRTALTHGVPAAALLVETVSRDTLGNARYSAALLLARDWRRIVLVTDRTHLPRAALLFRLAGLEVVGRFGVRYPSRCTAICSALYEAAATVWSLARVVVGAVGTLIGQRRNSRLE
ncbi:MAG: YdcF family protein [Alphaproteobacteria bacterium]|nr:YdcF family protein [Alphaproteobacteria bacterium]